MTKIYTSKMKSCEDDNSDEYDLFSGFADWFEKYGLTKVVDIEGADDTELAIEAALEEIRNCDPLTVWVEGRHNYQIITPPTKKMLDRDSLLAAGMDCLVSVWFSEQPYQQKKFEPVITGGCYLCELCEDLEDFSKCNACNGDGSFYIEVRLASWKNDVVEHLSELTNRGAEDLPESFWKNDEMTGESADERKVAKTFCENCGSSLGEQANFCSSCGVKT